MRWLPSPSNQATMEFPYKNYLVRFVRNATDSILRLEETTTHKLYETTLYERDVLEYSALGGIDFVSGLIFAGLRKPDEEDGASKSRVKTTVSVQKEALSLTFSHLPAFVAKPIVISLLLPSIRRSSAAEDSEAMLRRIRELETKLEDMSKYVTELEDTMAEVEDRTGIVALGGGPPCPIDISSVTICVVNGSPRFLCGKEYVYATQWNSTERGLESLKGLQYLKNCTSLVIGGCHPSLTDFSDIGSMRNLQSLTITCDTDGSGQNPGGYNVLRPQLRDISWISNLTQLRTLNFHGCQQLADLTPLKELPHLVSLRISSTAVTNTDWLSVSKPKCVITK